MKVKLTSSEIMMAAIAGVMRQVSALSKNRNESYGAQQKDDWQLHIEGCLGEYALSKHLNLYWAGKGNLRDFDVGYCVDVRTRSKSHYDLILHPPDPDDRIFFLLTGLNGDYEIKGWIKGIDGKKDCYYGDKYNCGRPAFFIPQEDLNSLESYDSERG
jgi:hypothetical protein